VNDTLNFRAPIYLSLLQNRARLDFANLTIIRTGLRAAPRAFGDHGLAPPHRHLHSRFLVAGWRAG
jgi:hypothetical protein